MNILYRDMSLINSNPNPLENVGRGLHAESQRTA